MPRHHKFNLGQYQCVCLEESHQMVPVSSEFPQVAASDLIAAHQEFGGTDDIMEVGFNYLLVDTGQYAILFDSGRGGGGLLDSLSEAGYPAEKINAIVVTHGDGDHVGGLLDFPNAHFIYPEVAYKWWVNPSSREHLKKEFASTFAKILPADGLAKAIEGREKYGAETLPLLGGRLNLIREGEPLLNGMQFFPTPGHRSDHFAIWIESQGQSLIVAADAFRHGFQTAHTDWYSIYDSYPVQWQQSLEQLLTFARQRKALVFANHLTFPGLIQL